MILYHGSNMKIEAIDLQKCKPYKDFGQGFYCTTIKNKQNLWQKELLKDKVGIKTVNTFELKELTYKELTDQYSFHTGKALKYLKGV